MGTKSTGSAFRNLRLLLRASLPWKTTLPKRAVITQESRGCTCAYSTIFSANFSVLNCVTAEVNISVSGSTVALCFKHI